VGAVKLPTVGWLCDTGQASRGALNPNLEVAPISIDTRTLRAGDVFWALKATRDGHDFVGDAFAKGAKAAVVSESWKASAPPAFRERLIGLQDTYRDLQQAARDWRSTWRFPVIGVTGSNGKTSTKDLIRRALSVAALAAGTEGNLNNEIGVPLTVLGARQDARFAVIEMGASHRGDIRTLCGICRPTHGLVTSIAAAHLEGFGDLATVAGTKGELYDFIADHGVAFVPTDDDRCREQSARCRKRVGYGFRAPLADWNAESHIASRVSFDARGCARFDFEKTPVHLSVAGRPAALAALAALTVARHFGIPPAACADVIADWPGIPGRTSVEPIGGILVVDDSYNANPESMRAALETLSLLPSSRKVAVLGDMNELGAAAEAEHRALARQLPKYGVGFCIFIGRYADLFSATARESGIEIRTFADCETAAGLLTSLLRPGDAVLVKGSRGVHLEQIVSLLRKRFA
jgi:UDP-N-acetylmuramoyl-tripeptide--D-alanyl-D-alanine ligase